jgi:hypothetical protein
VTGSAAVVGALVAGALVAGAAVAGALVAGGFVAAGVAFGAQAASKLKRHRMLNALKSI